MSSMSDIHAIERSRTNAEIKHLVREPETICTFSHTLVHIVLVLNDIHKGIYLNIYTAFKIMSWV